MIDLEIILFMTYKWKYYWAHLEKFAMCQTCTKTTKKPAKNKAKTNMQDFTSWKPFCLSSFWKKEILHWLALDCASIPEEMVGVCKNANIHKLRIYDHLRSQKQWQENVTHCCIVYVRFYFHMGENHIRLCNVMFTAKIPTWFTVYNIFFFLHQSTQTQAWWQTSLSVVKSFWSLRHFCAVPRSILI